jgi:hemerythrin-like domain-containing protein
MAAIDRGITRRGALGAVAAGTVLVGCARSGHATTPREHEEVEVTPAEDLMREHGVLRRVMFVFDDAAHRLDTAAALPLDALAAAAGLLRRVVEDYHEKLEEQHLFPRFEQAATLTDLVAILRRQHEAGRGVISEVLALSAGTLGDPERARLAAALRAFNRMYRPHAAREDTVLFPALRELVGAAASRELGEQFEEIEEQTLGKVVSAIVITAAILRLLRPEADRRSTTTWGSVAAASPV